MLDGHTLPLLKRGRNLLAFSGGVDSSALFFLLLRADIPFDIAHVNYHTRPQSDTEAEHARTLATQYGKRCFVYDAAPIEKNFEAEARRVRYAFFDALAAEHRYDTLLTAHQLDDRLEWLLMQLCKGAGVPELLGIEAVSQRHRYTLLRPLLRCSKSELRCWLEEEKLPFFEDESNDDPRFRRNRIRHEYASGLLESCRRGIEKSFDYLSRDARHLQPDITVWLDDAVLLTAATEDRLALMRLADGWLKRKGYLLRRGEREKILQEDELIIGRRYALSITPVCVLLTPRLEAAMPKTFKEQCRRLGIGAKVRPYLYADPASFEAVKALVTPLQAAK